MITDTLSEISMFTEKKQKFYDLVIYNHQKICTFKL